MYVCVCGLKENLSNCILSISLSSCLPFNSFRELAFVDTLNFETLCPMLIHMQAKLIIHVAYGSQRHLAGFKDLGLQPDQIFIHGSKRTSRSSHCCQVRESVLSWCSCLVAWATLCHFLKGWVLISANESVWGKLGSSTVCWSHPSHMTG